MAKISHFRQIVGFLSPQKHSHHKNIYGAANVYGQTCPLTVFLSLTQFNQENFVSDTLIYYKDTCQFGINNMGKNSLILVKWTHESKEETMPSTP